MLSGSALFAQSSGLRFEVSFPKSANATPLDGHVMLMISTNDREEPRFQIAEDFAESQQAFGFDVDKLAPDAPAVVDAKTFGYPTRSLADIPAGDYYVQGLINIYETFHLSTGNTVKLPPEKGEGSHWQTKPGNLYSKPQKMHLDPKASQVIRISLAEKIPPIEKELAEVDGVLDWGRGLGEPVSENKWVKRVRLQSELLTKFWGRPTYLGAILLLPDGYDEHPNARYPVVVEQDHFHRDLFLPNAFRTEPPDPKLKGGPLEHAQYGYKFYQDWTSGRLPRVIMVTIQHPTPYFDDSYAVNSVNNGPYGDAIMQELIPEIEKRFRIIREPYARILSGGSTGGWESAALQIFHPDFFGGAWSYCPDSVTFSDVEGVNIYEDENAFYKVYDWRRVPTANSRMVNGQLVMTSQQRNFFELVNGTHGRSGEQIDIWSAVFGPIGKDGYFEPLFDKRTGVINKQVAQYWGEH